MLKEKLFEALIAVFTIGALIGAAIFIPMSILIISAIIFGIAWIIIEIYEKVKKHKNNNLTKQSQYSENK
jgi:predicted membrane-bound dolichyl-phosphate-mannose-protein mannosyltransferase